MRTTNWLLVGALLGPLAARAQVKTITVDLPNRTTEALKKPGLGSLYGLSAAGGGIQDKTLLSDALLTIATAQKKLGNTDLNATDKIGPMLRGTGVKLICRFNDMVPGWQYQWESYATWISDVTKATQDMKDNYRDVVLCVAPFNEPDWTEKGSFMSDPAIQGTSYDERVNWLWTQTVRAIRAVDATIPLMGPNYLSYRPWQRSGADQTRMQNFLQNAINTNTVPDLMAWHALLSGPGEVPQAVPYYRALETQLNLPGAPKKLVVEEFGEDNGEFEGVPGSMLKHMAELERARVDYGAMGIYANGGRLGNTLRYDAWDSQPLRNGGWYVLNWYKQMTGVYVPVSGWQTRGTQAFDGIASYDEASKTATLILGGSADQARVVVPGVASLIGPQVRVQVETSVWDLATNEVGAQVILGGDPKAGTFNVLDRTLTCDASGSLTIPLGWLEKYDGYRVRISPPAAAGPYANKYEAETATLTGGAAPAASALASGGQYVGSLGAAGSAAEFRITVPAAGIYKMQVRYATPTGAGASQTLTVNGATQGTLDFGVATTAGAADELRFATRRVLLQQGSNVVRLAANQGEAQLDYLTFFPDTHHYEAELADVHSANKSMFPGEFMLPNYVGGINAADAYVEFLLDAPQAGPYELQVAYANGLGAATHALTVNGQAIGNVNYPSTGGWLGPNPRTNRALTTIPVTLKQGLNVVRLTKGSNYAELDYVALAVAGTALAAQSPVQLPSPVACYPNPSGPTEAFSLQVAGAFSYTILNVLGMPVEKGQGVEKATVGAALRPGIYLVRVQHPAGTSTIKVLKQ